MANNRLSRHACPAAWYVVTCVPSHLFWWLKYTVILPLATMDLMALFVLWKDNTTSGKLLVQEIKFVRETTPAGQFPFSECQPSSVDLQVCHYRNADADRSLMQLVTALWAILALMYVSLTVVTRKCPARPERMCICGDRINGNNGGRNEYT